jgi:hypothetical protein
MRSLCHAGLQVQSIDIARKTPFHGERALAAAMAKLPGAADFAGLFTRR